MAVTDGRNLLRTIRLAIWGMVALAAAGLAYLLLRPQSAPPTDGTQIRMVDFGGPFTLVDAKGQPFGSRQLAGKPYAIFFGFTHCPDVCPTTLARLVRLREQLGTAGEPLQIVFVTVDPERDGPREVGKYAELFDAPVVGLTGSPAQIDQVRKSFGILARKVPADGGDYSVDHTATVLLFGRDGKFVSTVSQEEPDAMALDKLRRITA